jgi:hypothetical protein
VAINAVDGLKLRAFIIGVAVSFAMASVSVVSAGVSDPTYQEGFGANATGGAGKPTYVVTAASGTGPGSFYMACQPWDTCHDVNIVFAVSKFTTLGNLTIGSNVTIDGCANGQNGVIFDHGGVGDVKGSPSQDPSVKRSLVIVDPADNIVIRCINFIGYGWPSIETTTSVAEYNYIWLAPSNGGTISNVLVDRCTFTRSTNKPFDVTGGTGTIQNVTFQRNLLHDNALDSLYKYADGVTAIKRNISLHHNVYTHGGERLVGQIKDAINTIDVVNNVAYVNAGDVPTSPDGGTIIPYALRIWNSNATAQATGAGRAGGPDSGDSWAGSSTVNVVANAWLGDRGFIEVRTDSGASEAKIYIGADNYFDRLSNNPDSYHHYVGSPTALPPGTITLPWNVPNPIPTTYQVTTLPVSQLKSQVLPYVGAPNRTALDQQRVDEVAAALPGSIAAPPPPSNLTVR